MKLRPVLIGLAAVLLVSCQGAPVKDYRTSSEVDKRTEEESRLWVMSRRFDKAIRKLGSIEKDDAAERYVQSIMDRLYPEFIGKIRVKIIKTPVLNAFALPNGSIYFHVGLLARLDNEAQLATILAHEGAHFIKKHGLRQQRTIKGASLFATVMAVAGIPILGTVLAVSSITGFSQDLEREADAMAYDRLLRAGYDTREASKVFVHLAKQVKALEKKEPYFFSTHPRLQERIDSFNELAKKQKSKGGRIGEQDYLDATNRIRYLALQRDLEMHRYQSVIVVLENNNTAKRYTPRWHYYLGEAYRLRAKKQDQGKAIVEYEKSISGEPDFAPPYRALGVIMMKNKKYHRAKELLKTYLVKSPDAADAGYVRSYLKLIEQKI